MISLRRRLYRERRMLVAIALLMFIEGPVAGINEDRVLLGIPLQLTCAVYGCGWLDRFFPARSRTLYNKVRIRLSPEVIWSFLVVTPDTVDAF